MKYIAVFLASCIMFLSSVSGMANTAHHAVTACCCKQNSHTKHCGQQKNTPCNDCAKGTCNMIACGTCEFLIVPFTSISPSITNLKGQIAYPFIIGDLSDYHSKGWNPPKV